MIEVRGIAADWGFRNFSYEDINVKYVFSSARSEEPTGDDAPSERHGG